MKVTLSIINLPPPLLFDLVTKMSQHDTGRSKNLELCWIVTSPMFFQMNSKARKQITVENYTRSSCIFFKDLEYYFSNFKHVLIGPNICFQSTFGLYMFLVYQSDLPCPSQCNLVKIVRYQFLFIYWWNYFCKSGLKFWGLGEVLVR